jgi:hypothetical protein
MLIIDIAPSGIVTARNRIPLKVRTDNLDVDRFLVIIKPYQFNSSLLEDIGAEISQPSQTIQISSIDYKQAEFWIESRVWRFLQTQIPTINFIPQTICKKILLYIVAYQGSTVIKTTTINFWALRGGIPRYASELGRILSNMPYERNMSLQQEAFLYVLNDATENNTLTLPHSRTKSCSILNFLPHYKYLIKGMEYFIEEIDVEISQQAIGIAKLTCWQVPVN